MPEFRSRLKDAWSHYKGLGFIGHYDTDIYGTIDSNPEIYYNGSKISNPAINRMLQKLGKSAEIIEVGKQYMGNMAGMTIIENASNRIRIWLREDLNYIQKPFAAIHEIAHHVVDKYKSLLTHDETEEMCDRIACNELGLAYRPI